MQKLLLTATKFIFFTFCVEAVHALHSNFDVRETAIEDIHNALNTGLASCRGILESFIARIEAYNPELNAILTLNPDALCIADSLDLALVGGIPRALSFAFQSY